jgi:hypothetical protein
MNMNEEQSQFFDFFMERIVEGKEEEAKALLMDGFEKQAAGGFDMQYLQEVIPKYFTVLKPEHIGEFQKAMSQFMPF